MAPSLQIKIDGGRENVEVIDIPLNAGELNYVPRVADEYEEVLDSPGATHTPDFPQSDSSFPRSIDCIQSRFCILDPSSFNLCTSTSPAASPNIYASASVVNVDDILLRPAHPDDSPSLTYRTLIPPYVSISSARREPIPASILNSVGSFNPITNLGMPFMLRDLTLLREDGALHCLWEVKYESRHGDDRPHTPHDYTRMTSESFQRWHTVAKILFIIREALKAKLSPLPEYLTHTHLDYAEKQWPNEYPLGWYALHTRTLKAVENARSFFYPIWGDLGLLSALWGEKESAWDIGHFISETMQKAGLKDTAEIWAQCPIFYLGRSPGGIPIQRMGLHLDVSMFNNLPEHFLGLILRYGLPLRISWPEWSVLKKTPATSNLLRRLTPTTQQVEAACMLYNQLHSPPYPKYVDPSQYGDELNKIPLTYVQFFRRNPARRLSDIEPRYLAELQSDACAADRKVYIWVADGVWLCRRQVLSESHDALLAAYHTKHIMIDHSGHEWDIFGGCDHAGFSYRREPHPLPNLLTRGTQYLDMQHRQDDLSLALPPQDEEEQVQDDGDDQWYDHDDGTADPYAVTINAQNLGITQDEVLRTFSWFDPEMFTIGAAQHGILRRIMVQDPFNAIVYARYGYIAQQNSIAIPGLHWRNQDDPSQLINEWTSRSLGTLYSIRADDVDWDGLNFVLLRDYTRAIDLGLSVPDNLCLWRKLMPQNGTFTIPGTSTSFTIWSRSISVTPEEIHFVDHESTSLPKDKPKKDKPKQDKPKQDKPKKAVNVIEDAYFIRIGHMKSVIMLNNAMNIGQCLVWLKDLCVGIQTPEADGLWAEMTERLIARGIPFRTVFLLRYPKDRPVPARKRMSDVGPVRGGEWEATYRDFAMWEIVVRTFLRSPRGRAALLCGGIIWRIAVEYGPDDLKDRAKGGPSRMGSQLLATDTLLETSYWDDVLSDDEIHLLTGTYAIATGVKHQYLFHSWFPRPNAWIDYGYWPQFYEDWFKQRLHECRSGSGVPKNSKDWDRNVKAIQPAKATRFLSKAKEKAVRDLGLAALAGVAVVTSMMHGRTEIW